MTTPEMIPAASQAIRKTARTSVPNMITYVLDPGKTGRTTTEAKPLAADVWAMSIVALIARRLKIRYT
jgi:hypothetical protein